MRTIYIVDDKVWQSLPIDTVKAVLIEFNKVYAFIGQIPKEKAMSIQLTQPAQFPEKFDFSDAVVRLVESNAGVDASQAMRLQRKYAAEELKKFKVVLSPNKTRPIFKPELMGTASSNKSNFLTSSGKKASLSMMASFVNLDKAIAATADEYLKHEINITRRRERLFSKGEDAKLYDKAVIDYFSSKRFLRDTMDRVVIDNQNNPEEWLTVQQTLLGKVIARSMAHEARHLFIMEHDESSEPGLGNESPNLVSDKTGGNFSKDDRKNIRKALNKWDIMQKRSINISTFPKRVRKNPASFPF